MSWHNPDDEVIHRLLTAASTIAVVGCSPKPERTSYQIAAFLKEHGYRIIPVHPAGGTIHGEQVYVSLLDIPKDIQIDIVDVFRRPEFTPDIARQSVQIKAGALWLQQGIASQEAFDIATSGELTCVMDRCIAVMHRLLVRQ